MRGRAWMLLLLAGAGLMATTAIAEENAAAPAVECWRMAEFEFTSTQDYAKPLEEVAADATFSHEDGAKIVRPVFWDGERTWRVRFAPAKAGTWRMTTACSNTADAGLHGQQRTLKAVPYAGKLPIYEHGFLKISEDRRRLVHADGTPFLWMSEDHACMDKEKFSESNKPGKASQFKFIADLRRRQNFTVYQSVVWSSGAWASPGVRPKLEYYRDLDRKYAYLAELGFVHNIALGYHKDLGDGAPNAERIKAMKLAARYVEARYGAYPMTYYTCGEFNIPAEKDVDPARQGGDRTYNRSWWGEIATEIHRHNSYGHPSSINFWQPQGTWFAGEPFMTFWDLQGYSLRDFHYYHYFWQQKSPKPIVDSFSGMDHGNEKSQASQRGIAYLVMQSGGAGFGMLTEGIWNNCYTKDSGICVEQWGGTPWFTSVDWASGKQLAHVYAFYTARAWWKLVPRSGDPAWGTFDDARTSPISSDGEGTVVVYFYGKNNQTGELKNLPAGKELKASWYDPRNGTYTPIGQVTAGAGGAWSIPVRPTAEDWVLLVEPAK